MAGDWNYLAAHLGTGMIIGELPLSGVGLNKPINDSGKFGGVLTLSTASKFPGDPYTMTTPARTVIYAYLDGVPWGGYIIWTRSYDSATGKVTLGGADWWSYFDHRIVAQLLDTADGISAVSGTQVSYSGQDQNAVARSLVALAQSHTGGDIGIVLDGSLSGVDIDRTYYGYSLSTVGDMLRDLTGVIGGPDIRFDVGSPQDASNRPQRVMIIGAPTLGLAGPDSPHVLEYGGNLLSYTWPSDASGMATRAYATGDGTEVSMPVAIHEDTTKYDDGWSLTEVETGYSTVEDGTTLLAHARADQAARKLPQVVPTCVVNADVDPKLGQIAPGDAARCIIKDAFFANGLDTTMRIVNIAPDTAGGSLIATLSMNPTLDDVA